MIIKKVLHLRFQAMEVTRFKNLREKGETLKVNNGTTMKNKGRSNKMKIESTIT